MQFRLLDILADPDNPDIWPLKLEIFTSKEMVREIIPEPHKSTARYCKFYCHTKDAYLVSNPLKDDEKTLDISEIEKIVSKDDCLNCLKTEVIDGILYHNDDKLKWFIIDDEIPVMFPLELRDENQEIRFIEKYKSECKRIGITEPLKK